MKNVPNNQIFLELVELEISNGTYTVPLLEMTFLRKSNLTKSLATKYV